MRILLVEDDPSVATATARVLLDAGYLVSMADNGDDALRLGLAGGNDLVLVDLGLPGRNGLAVIRGLREAGQQMAIIILSGAGEDANVVAGLDAGADDFLQKPAAPDVLLARIRAALRRAAPSYGELLEVGPLTLDRRARKCCCEGRELALTTLDVSLLEQFMLRPGQVVTRAELLAVVWGMDFDPGSNMVDAEMNRLRTKLRAQDCPSEITTVRGVGFTLAARAAP